MRMPSAEAAVRNLNLNQRVSLNSLFISPNTWRLNNAAPDPEAFTKYPVHIGLDLSMRTDLTAAVACCVDDDGIVHVIPFVFAPSLGLSDRATRDKTPYADWVRDGFMFTTPGASVDYKWVCEFLVENSTGWSIESIEFDRWRIDIFKAAAAETGLIDLVTEFKMVGQGYKDFSPRVEAIEVALLSGKVRHGGHPLLNMSVANAIVTTDPAGSRKLDKSQSTARIDPLVAMTMAVYPCTDGKAEDVDVSSWI
jgi:phage terminase large subunit-like protein